MLELVFQLRFKSFLEEFKGNLPPKKCWYFTLDMVFNHMGVSKNRGTPKWMVYTGNPY